MALTDTICRHCGNGKTRHKDDCPIYSLYLKYYEEEYGELWKEMIKRFDFLKFRKQEL